MLARCVAAASSGGPGGLECSGNERGEWEAMSTLVGSIGAFLSMKPENRRNLPDKRAQRRAGPSRGLTRRAAGLKGVGRIVSWVTPTGPRSLLRIALCVWHGRGGGQGKWDAQGSSAVCPETRTARPIQGNESLLNPATLESGGGHCLSEPNLASGTPTTYSNLLPRVEKSQRHG